MSCNLQKFAGEVGQNLGAAGGEVHIVLDANAAPAGTINARLDRHDCALPERRFDGLCQPRRFVDLEAEAVTEAVAERVAIAAVFDVAASEAVRLLPLHPRPH